MAPKFRGDSDDWLDSDESGKKGQGLRPKKKIQARSVALPPEEANATVIEVYPNQCRVRLDSGADFLCSYRRAGVVSKSKTDARERTPVAVGDRVRVSGSPNSQGVVEGICQRTNALSRPAPGRDGEKIQHVLAANIDLLVIVASAVDPIFSPGLVDRFLVSAQSENISVLICVTKIDLKPSASWEIYTKLGYSLVEVSSMTKAGIPELSKLLQGKMVVFCGQSGVGKTSLLRALLGTEIGRVGSVNEMTGKGRHTTTAAVLLEGPNQSKWVDTPGIRSFGLHKIQPEDLKNYFPEMENLSCSMEGCFHQDEENCAAVHLDRYPSYRRILESLIEGEN